jgi:hypothetical protein
MTTFLIVLFVWTMVAVFAGWVVAQCIQEMGETDPMEQVDAETRELLKRLNKETS